MKYEECPFCLTDLTQSVESNGQTVMGTRLIMVEVRGVYDGGLYFLCPDCDVAFHRWEETSPDMRAKAQIFIDRHNKGDT